MSKDTHQIKIEWTGPFSAKDVISRMVDGGDAGDDYGLHQIYGKHILCGADTLLYIGKATEQTFSDRFKQHLKEFLYNEEDIEVYLGRIYDPKRHTKKDNWRLWNWDVSKGEQILIYKYSPNYNNRGIGDKPSLTPYKNIRLIHRGERHNLNKRDNAPEDYS